MNNSISITPRRLLVVGLFGLLAVLSYGFAATNTVPASNAGDGAAAITGYTVTAVHYNLNTTNPANADSVAFTLAPALVAGGTIRISTNGTTFIPASCTGTSAIVCTFPANTTALSLTNLRVVAAQ